MQNDESVFSQDAVFAHLYESCFIGVIKELAGEKNFKKGDFAQQVWPESSPKVARNRWERMRTEDGRTGKPVVCSLSDAYRMAKVLGLQMSYVTLQAEFAAEKRMKEMEQAKIEPAKPEKPGPAKRKNKAAERSPSK